MASWILTLGLQNLRRQVNAAFPHRDTTSDGTIGDAAHQVEVSGHNPDDTPGSRPEWDGDPDSTPEVRAWDMDSDLNCPGVTTQQLVDHIRALPGISSVLRYMIYNRLIYEAGNSWRPRAYTGASAHTEHVHFSGAYSQDADNNTTFDYRLTQLLPEDDVNLTDKVGSKAYAGRTVADVLNDVEALRDVLVGDVAGTKVAAYRTTAPIMKLAAMPTQLDALGKALLAAIAANKGQDVDEAAIAAGVLAGLTPDRLAAAVTAAGLTPDALAAAIPADMAQRVVDELAARIAQAGPTAA